MKKERQQRILEIIENNNVETQDDLIKLLKKSGFDVTQATISRDIRELKLTKVTSSSGSYKYVVPSSTVTGEPKLVFSSAMISSINNIDHAQNIIVIKTNPGMANAVAVMIDKDESEEILGCIAGDDTILVVTRSQQDAETITGQLLNMIRKS